MSSLVTQCEEPEIHNAHRRYQNTPLTNSCIPCGLTSRCQSKLCYCPITGDSDIVLFLCFTMLTTIADCSRQLDISCCVAAHRTQISLAAHCADWLRSFRARRSQRPCMVYIAMGVAEAKCSRSSRVHYPCHASFP